ncbi:MAG: GNAT family N-acetyltransferase [Deltaproteobacteria bacterium]|nr:GNAT family N-acetyltransferase [Deltaproteobacteria bacterium]
MIPLDRYPKEITLKDAARVTFRPMVPEDADRLWDFFRRIPPEDKMYFREDVDRREEVDRWARNLDYDTVLPVLAVSEGRVVGDATLHRNKAGWKQRVGTVRILIAPDFRHRGLGTAMIRELRHLGEKASLHYLLAEVIEEQQAAIKAFEKMGFERAVVYRNYVNDQRGRLHNLVVLLYPMSLSEDEEFY